MDPQTASPGVDVFNQLLNFIAVYHSVGLVFFGASKKFPGMGRDIRRSYETVVADILLLIYPGIVHMGMLFHPC